MYSSYPKWSILSDFFFISIFDLGWLPILRLRVPIVRKFDWEIGKGTDSEAKGANSEGLSWNFFRYFYVYYCLGWLFIERLRVPSIKKSESNEWRVPRVRLRVPIAKVLSWVLLYIFVINKFWGKFRVCRVTPRVQKYEIFETSWKHGVLSLVWGVQRGESRKSRVLFS